MDKIEHAVVIMPSARQMRALADGRSIYGDGGDGGDASVRSFAISMDRLRNRVFLQVNGRTYSTSSAVNCCYAFHSALLLLRFSLVCSLASSPAVTAAVSNMMDGGKRFVSIDESEVQPHCRPLWRAARAFAGIVDSKVWDAWKVVITSEQHRQWLFCIRPEDGALDKDTSCKFPSDVRSAAMNIISSVSDKDLSAVSDICGFEKSFNTLDSCASELRFVAMPSFASTRSISQQDSSTPALKLAVILFAVFFVIFAIAAVGSTSAQKNGSDKVKDNK